MSHLTIRPTIRFLVLQRWVGGLVTTEEIVGLRRKRRAKKLCERTGNLWTSCDAFPCCYRRVLVWKIGGVLAMQWTF